MKNYTVRLAEPKDAAQLTNWLNNTPDNLFDPDVFNYPTIRILVVEADGEPVVYVPFHVVFQLESLAVRPGVDKKQLAYSLRTVEKALAGLAEPYGVKELFAQCADESFNAFAMRHGWAPVKHKYLRRKV